MIDDKTPQNPEAGQIPEDNNAADQTVAGQTADVLAADGNAPVSQTAERETSADPAADEAAAQDAGADEYEDEAPDALSPMARADEPLNTRCGFVALIGVPNAGKSTLLNALVGAKVSIISRKVQTTRVLVRGIAIEGASQMIFVDTPGIFRPKRRLDRAMVSTAWGGAGDADVVCLLVDARKGIDEEVDAVLERLVDVRKPKVLILNKIDLMKRERLLALAAAVNEKGNFDRTFMISAMKGDGVNDLKSWLAERMPPDHWHYPEDQIADAPLRQLAAEITREKLFDRLHDEVPYASTVETDTWKQQRDGSVRIEQTIFVERESQRSIVLGKNGQAIKSIGSAARIDIAEAADCKVHLFLFVKVRENWGDDPARYREMGLDFPRN